MQPIEIFIFWDMLRKSLKTLLYCLTLPDLAQVTHLQESTQKEKTQFLEVQQALQVKERESEKLKDVINTVKMNAERQTQEFQVLWLE